MIHAEGELQESLKLLAAAQMLAKEPAAMQLRLMHTLTQIAGDRESTTVFPLPIDIRDTLAPGKAAGRR